MSTLGITRPPARATQSAASNAAPQGQAMTTLPLSGSAAAQQPAAQQPAAQPAPAAAPAPVPLAQTVEHVSLVPAPLATNTAVSSIGTPPAAGSTLPALPPELAAALEGIEEFAEQTALLREAMPRVFICQPSTPGRSEHGWSDGLWTHRATGAQKDTLRMVIVFWMPQRAMRPKFKVGADEQAAPVCVSLDGIHGVGSEEHDAKGIERVALSNDSAHNGYFDIAPGQKCAGCKWSQWEGKGKNTVKPACEEQWIAVGLEEEWGPVAVTVRSTGIAPLRTFKSLSVHRLQQLRAQADPRLGKLNSQFFGVAVLTTKLESKGSSVPYYIPQFALEPTPEPLFRNAIDPMFIGAIKDLHKQLLTREGMAEADTGAAEASGPDTSTDFNPSAYE